MEYHILIAKTKQKIASFENQLDRDICLAALIDYFEIESEYLEAQDD